MSSLFGVELPTPVNFVIAFVFVLLLIGAAAWLVRRFGATRIDAAARGRQPRLAVIDSAAVDGRRKLVIIRRDNVEHLLMIGGPTDVVVETNHRPRHGGRDPRRAAPRATATPRPRRAPCRCADPTPWPLQPEPVPLQPVRAPQRRAPRADDIWDAPAEPPAAAARPFPTFARCAPPTRSPASPTNSPARPPSRPRPRAGQRRSRRPVQPLRPTPPRRRPQPPRAAESGRRPEPRRDGAASRSRAAPPDGAARSSPKPRASPPPLDVKAVSAESAAAAQAAQTAIGQSRTRNGEPFEQTRKDLTSRGFAACVRLATGVAIALLLFTPAHAQDISINFGQGTGLTERVIQLIALLDGAVAGAVDPGDDDLVHADRRGAVAACAPRSAPRPRRPMR